jgi:MFS family permease
MNWWTIQACSFAAFGGILFGMDQGNYNGASQYDSFFNTFCVAGGYGTLAQCKAPSEQKPTAWVNLEALFAPSLQVGSALSSLLLAPLIARGRGRRWCIFVGAWVAFGGMLAVAFTSTAAAFLSARVLSGLGVGLVTYAVPQYTSELAPKQSRGALSSLFQLATITGVLLAMGITLKHDGHWSVPFVAPCAPAALIGCCIFRFPESPRWLLRWRGEAEAAEVLRRLRGAGDGAAEDDGDDWREELEEMKAALREEGVVLDSAGGSTKGWAGERKLHAGQEQEQEEHEQQQQQQQQEQEEHEQEQLQEQRVAAAAAGAWSDSTVRWRVTIAVCLQLGQQLTGINGFTTLGTQFFRNAGVRNAFVSNFLSGFGSFFGTSLQIAKVDAWGRRPMLLGGMAAMGAAMLGCALLVQAYPQGRVPPPPAVGPAMVALVTLFHFAFGLSWGPVCWLYPSEIFPMGVKERAMSYSVSANYAANVAILLLISKLSAWSHAGMCFVLAAVCALTLLLTWQHVPETKGVALEDMGRVFAVAPSAGSGACGTGETGGGVAGGDDAGSGAVTVVQRGGYQSVNA